MIELKVQRESGDVSVWYRKGHQYWQVDTEKIDGKGWRDYAVSQADAAMVRQLLRKDYDIRY